MKINVNRMKSFAFFNCPNSEKLTASKLPSAEFVVFYYGIIPGLGSPATSLSWASGLSGDEAPSSMDRNENTDMCVDQEELYKLGKSSPCSSEYFE